jgi:alkylhydroperoxidase family enzyme
MRRRNLVTVLAGAAAYPLLVGSQQKALPVIRYLGNAAPGPAALTLGAFLQGLRVAGYVEGQNVTIEYRWAEGRYDRLPAPSADLVDRRVDVIAADGITPARAAKHTTWTIPIVFIGGGDQVERGLVASFARPGGNLTGVAIMNTELMSKRLEEILRSSEGRMEFIPNSQLIMARRPEILRAFAQLGAATNGPSSTIDPQLRNVVSQMASRAAGCGYCMAHTAHTAERVGIAAEKENALREFETSPLSSAAERAALRVAQGAAQVPNGVTNADFAELKKH